MRSLLKIFITASLAVMASQCARTKDYGTLLKVDKGVEVPGGSKDPFPFVVPINDSRCTGAFIGPNVLLTAAHCIPNHKIEYNGHSAIHVRYSSQFGAPEAVPGSDAHSAWQYKHDIAFGIFKDDIAPAVARLSKVTPRPGEPIAIVGYGCFSARKYFSNLKKLEMNQKLTQEDLALEGAGTKRFGYNFIQMPQFQPIASQGMLTIRTFNQPVVESVVLGKDVGACPGDSGGPMLYNNEIVGVASYISPLDNEVYNTFDSYYADIHEPMNWRAIQDMLTMGKVAGYKGSRPIWPRKIPPVKPKQEHDLKEQLPQGMVPPNADDTLEIPPDNHITVEDDTESAHKHMQDTITLAMTRISNCAIVEGKLVQQVDSQGTYEFQAQAVFLDGTLSPAITFTTNYVIQNTRSLATSILKEMFDGPMETRIFQHRDPQKRARLGCQYSQRR